MTLVRNVESNIHNVLSREYAHHSVCIISQLLVYTQQSSRNSVYGLATTISMLLYHMRLF